MYVIILFLHLMKSIHNMFYKTTYNGITLQGWNNSILFTKNTLYITCRKNIKVWFVYKDITQWRFYINNFCESRMEKYSFYEPSMTNVFSVYLWRDPHHNFNSRLSNWMEIITGGHSCFEKYSAVNWEPYYILQFYTWEARHSNILS